MTAALRKGRGRAAHPSPFAASGVGAVVEAEGGGFVMEFADFIEAGIPVLTAVAARHQSGWQRFTGGLHAALPADEEALMAWCRAQLARRKQEGALKV